jgi:hypothetical protein
MKRLTPGPDAVMRVFQDPCGIHSEGTRVRINAMLKKIILIFWIFILFPAFSLEASPETIRKVFEYIDTRYAEPVNPSQMYIKTLDQLKNDGGGFERGSLPHFLR